MNNNDYKKCIDIFEPDGDLAQRIKAEVLRQGLKPVDEKTLWGKRSANIYKFAIISACVLLLVLIVPIVSDLSSEGKMAIEIQNNVAFSDLTTKTPPKDINFSTESATDFTEGGTKEESCNQETLLVTERETEVSGGTGGNSDVSANTELTQKSADNSNTEEPAATKVPELTAQKTTGNAATTMKNTVKATTAAKGTVAGTVSNSKLHSATTKLNSSTPTPTVSRTFKSREEFCNEISIDYYDFKNVPLNMAFENIVVYGEYININYKSSSGGLYLKWYRIGDAQSIWDNALAGSGVVKNINGISVIESPVYKESQLCGYSYLWVFEKYAFESYCDIDVFHMYEKEIFVDVKVVSVS